MILLSGLLKYDPRKTLSSVTFLLEAEVVTTKLVYSKSVRKICRQLLSAMNVLKSTVFRFDKI